MVSTRTQTGKIAQKRYDPLTLQLAATTITSPPTSPVASKRHASSSVLPQRSPKKVQKAKASPTTKTKPRRSTSPSVVDPKDTNFQKQMLLNYLPTEMVDICEGINFFPSRAWGEREEVGLSTIQRAEREVEIWEEVKRSHAAGGLENMVPAIEACVESAREKLGALRRSEREGRVELGVVGEENPGATAIKQRLEVLEWALSTSEFDAEKDNIRGAIQGYQSGAIAYTDHFTLIYAGKVVDTAPTYGSFVRDRQERLDRYCDAHGQHWLWYEPPLDVHPETKPKANGSLALPRSDCWTNLGPWYITQGFWKRSGWVNRMAATSGTQPSHLEPTFERLPDGRVWCQDAGPKQVFRSLLDSGATYPSLYQEDFHKLMIDKQNYAAQSVDVLGTANGSVISRIFELFVCVLDEQQKQLVDENHCAWPYHAKYLGGLCPVTELRGSIAYDPQGREITLRLSGLLPFVACYFSSTPTRNTLFLGEDRKDVLGSHRMPGQRKWDISIPPPPPMSKDVWAKYGDPKTTFSHRMGRIVDEDDQFVDFASTITFNKWTKDEYSYRNYPKNAVETERANVAATEVEKRNDLGAPQTVAEEAAARAGGGTGPFRAGAAALPLIPI